MIFFLPGGVKVLAVGDGSILTFVVVVYIWSVQHIF